MKQLFLRAYDISLQKHADAFEAFVSSGCGILSAPAESLLPVSQPVFHPPQPYLQEPFHFIGIFRG
jgi:hypothetical protein